MVGLSFILAFCQFNKFDHFMIEGLYHKADKPKKKSWWGLSGKKKKDDDDKNKKMTPMNDANTSWCRQRLHNSSISCCFKCQVCKMSREERLFEKARVTLKKELDIVKFIRNIRRINEL